MKTTLNIFKSIFFNISVLRRFHSIIQGAKIAPSFEEENTSSFNNYCQLDFYNYAVSFESVQLPEMLCYFISAKYIRIKNISLPQYAIILNAL